MDVIKLLKEGNLKVNLDNIRDVAETYKDLDQAGKIIKEKQDLLKQLLLDHEDLYEIFGDVKVVFQKGATYTVVDKKLLQQRVDYDKFVEMATVNKGSVPKDLLPEVEVELNPRAPSIKVSKLTKAELHWKKLREIQGETK